MPASTDHAYAPRKPDELEFDPTTGRLRLGQLDERLPVGASNRRVLDAYVGLVARRRGQRPQSMVEVRTYDIDTLSILLELDTENLAELLQEILGTSPEQAERLVTRLRARRSVLGFAAAAAGVVMVGGIALGVAGTRGTRAPVPVVDSPITGHHIAHLPVTTPSAPPSAAVTTSPDHPTPSIHTGANGTGLIAPESVDATHAGATGLVPAADATSGSTTSTTSVTTTTVPAANQAPAGH